MTNIERINVNGRIYDIVKPSEDYGYINRVYNSGKIIKIADCDKAFNSDLWVISRRKKSGVLKMIAMVHDISCFYNFIK